MSAPRLVFDASAMQALFNGHEMLYTTLQDAAVGTGLVFLPVAAIAEAEGFLGAGHNGWAIFFFGAGVESLPLTQHAAVEIGVWPGSLGVRHAAHEAAALDAVVVTCNPGAYKGMKVRLQVV